MDIFEDFHPGTNLEAARRQGSSLALAVLLYGGLFGGLVLATATVRRVVEDGEIEDIIFAPPPEPAPSTPPAPALAAPEKIKRPPVKRPTLTPPDEIAAEKPSESDRELIADEGAGPVEGSLLGVEGGREGGRALPAPPRAEPVLTQPKAIGSTFENRPRYPVIARRKGVEGVCTVEVEVTATGTVRSARVVSGPPELCEASLLRWAAGWRFKPATRDGKPIAWRTIKAIRYRLEDL